MTTLSGGVFVIANNGYESFDIATSDGLRRYTVFPGQACMVGLASTATATAGWVFGDFTPNLGTFSMTTYNIGSLDPNWNSAFQFYSHSSSLVVCAYEGTGTDAYAVAGSVSSGIITWGSPTLIRGGTIVNARGCAISSTVGCIMYNSSTGMVPVMYSISGTTFTLAPEPASTGAAGVWTTPIDSTRAAAVYTTGLKVLLWNGTGVAPTLSAGASISAGTDNYNTRAVLMDTDKIIVINIFASDSTRLNARVITTAGAPASAPVAGANVTLAVGSNPTGGATIPMDCIWVYSTSEVAVITGTTNTMWTTRITVSGTVPSLAGTFLEYLPYGGQGLVNIGEITSVVQFSATDGVVFSGTGVVQRVTYIAGKGLVANGAPFAINELYDQDWNYSSSQLTQYISGAKLLGTTTGFVYGAVNTKQGTGQTV
jgi:hypothetical protein